jgi:chromosome partitioning protein
MFDEASVAALIVAVANQKGGVGKTTTVVNLGAFLALAGVRVLVVDLDPQGNATSGLGVDRARLDRSLYDLLTEEPSAIAPIVPTAVPGLDLAPSSVALAGLEVELASVSRRERRLGDGLRPFTERYDLILIDSPPSLGLLTLNALTAADEVLVPIQCEYYALEGLGQLLATLDLVREHLNADLRLNGVVLTMWDPRTRLSADVAAEVRRHLPKKVYASVIPRSVRLSEAPSHGLPVALYRPESKGATAYRALAEEFRERSVTAGRQEQATTSTQPATSGGAPATETQLQGGPGATSIDGRRARTAPGRPETTTLAGGIA